jgi:hypothetical protein
VFPVDMIQAYPPSGGYILRVRVVRDAFGFLGEGFLQHREDDGDTPISIPVPHPFLPARTDADARHHWAELARTCGYEVLWVEGDN